MNTCANFKGVFFFQKCSFNVQKCEVQYSNWDETWNKQCSSKSLHTISVLFKFLRLPLERRKKLEYYTEHSTDCTILYQFKPSAIFKTTKTSQQENYLPIQQVQIQWLEEDSQVWTWSQTLQCITERNLVEKADQRTI